MRKTLLVVLSVMFLMSGFSLVSCQKKETAPAPEAGGYEEPKAPEAGGYGEQAAPEAGAEGEQKAPEAGGYGEQK